MTIQLTNDLSQARLWKAEPLVARALWERVERAYVGDNVPGGDWSFWLKWYERNLNGYDQPWTLLDDIAFNGHETGDYDAFWTGTDAQVNAKIMAIVERHELRQEVQRLKAELEIATIEHEATPKITRAHNLPPEIEMTDEAEDIYQIANVIRDTLEQTESELSQGNPDPRLIQKLGSGLLRAVRSVTEYCARVINRTVMSAATVFGAGFGATLISWVNNNQDALAKVGEWLLSFAKGLL